MSDSVELGSDFEHLFGKYFARLNSYAFKIVKNRDSAEDIVQDLFLSIWDRRDSIDPLTVESYLFVSLRNRCISHIRKSQTKYGIFKDVDDTIYLDNITNIDMCHDNPQTLIYDELKSGVDSAISQLPERCRIVFKMSREEGLKNREIAEKLDINIKSVEKHLSKALKRIKIHIEENLVYIIILIQTFI